MDELKNLRDILIKCRERVDVSPTDRRAAALLHLYAVMSCTGIRADPICTVDMLNAGIILFRTAQEHPEILDELFQSTRSDIESHLPYIDITGL